MCCKCHWIYCPPKSRCMAIGFECNKFACRYYTKCIKWYIIQTGINNRKTYVFNPKSPLYTAYAATGTIEHKNSWVIKRFQVLCTNWRCYIKLFDIINGWNLTRICNNQIQKYWGHFNFMVLWGDSFNIMMCFVIR